MLLLLFVLPEKIFKKPKNFYKLFLKIIIIFIFLFIITSIDL